MYTVNGSVDTITVKTDWGPDWHGFCEIPEFWIDAASQAEAEEMARNIIDPLHMTDIHITVARVNGKPSLLARLRRKIT